MVSTPRGRHGAQLPPYWKPVPAEHSDTGQMGEQKRTQPEEKE